MSSNWRTDVQDTVVQVMNRAVTAHPDRAYLDFQGQVHSYGAINEDANSLAHGLASLGVQKGDTVATMLDNNVDAVLAWFAINRLGAISVPLNTALKGEFLRHQISDSGARLMIAESHYVDRVLMVKKGIPTLTHLLHRGPRPAGSDTTLNFSSLDEARLTRTDSPNITVEPSDLALLIYTSGTTGSSKGCMISHNYACNIARQAIWSVSLTERDVYWTALPLFHMNATATTVLATAVVGARASVYPRFSLSGFWPDIERSGATVVTMLGSMMPLIAQAPDNENSKRCFGQLRLATGAPFPVELQEKWRSRFGVKDIGAAGYGFTEAAMVTLAKIGEPCPPNSSGKRAEAFEVLIVDDHDRELPLGTPGEVIVRPRMPHVMSEGYWKRPADTVKLMRNLWAHTGDIGKFDDEGWFYFLDRKKDYLRRRGENISSGEMETTFQHHPAIADVAVHAVASELGEDEVKVTCVLVEGSLLTEEELCRWTVDRVPYFAVPRYIEFRKDLPRNPLGKILKYQLRDEGCTPGTWDRERAGFKLEKR